MGGERDPVSEAIGIRDAPILRASSLLGFGMFFAELDCRRANVGVTKPVQEDGFLIALQLKPCSDFDLFADGRWIEPRAFDAGTVAIFDLRTNLNSDLRDPFHAIDLFIPIAALHRISQESLVPRIDDLRHVPGTAVHDPVLGHMLSTMRPALAAPPEETAPLFVDHVATAIAIHVAHAYGGMRLCRPVHRGGLAPRQLRRAKDLMRANLDGRLSLSDLASACGLSVRHFTRAFRQSTGLAPHRWLVEERLETARGLLSGSSRSLAEIALACGFANQSHFTREFRRAVGLAPGAWQRMTRR